MSAPLATAAATVATTAATAAGRNSRIIDGEEIDEDQFFDANTSTERLEGGEEDEGTVETARGPKHMKQPKNDAVQADTEPNTIAPARRLTEFELMHSQCSPRVQSPSSPPGSQHRLSLPEDAPSTTSPKEQASHKEEKKGEQVLVPTPKTKEGGEKTAPEASLSTSLASQQQPSKPTNGAMDEWPSLRRAISHQKIGAAVAAANGEHSAVDPLTQHMRHRRRQASVTSIPSVASSAPEEGTEGSTDGGSSTQQSRVAHAARDFFSGIKQKARHALERKDGSGHAGGDGETPVDRYIKIRTKRKPVKEFDKLSLVQELHPAKASPMAGPSSTPSGRSVPDGTTAANETGSQGPPAVAIWAIKFSMDGKYLATAGQDPVVTIWSVRSKMSRPLADNEIAEESGRELFENRPFRTFVGHQSTICDLAWSKSNFLLSSSMDRNVMLWHVSRNECLCVFQHSDYVTAITFHPKDDRYFISGSLDCKIRMWSVAEKRITNWVEVPDTNLITAVAFNSDGKSIMAGTYTGACFLYTVEGLKFVTSIQVRSSKGRNARGSKITGIECMAGTSTSDEQVLITTNDSRIRLYSLRDYNLVCKYKGVQNKNSQIRASFSEDGRYIICGSEDKCVYIWNTDPMDVETLRASQNASKNGKEGPPSQLHAGHRKPHIRRDRSAMFESFHASNTIITGAVFAPQTTVETFYDVLREQAETAARNGGFLLANPTTTTTNAHQNGTLAMSSGGKEGRPRRAQSFLRLDDGVPASHRLLVCSDHHGVIRVYENVELRERSNDLEHNMASSSSASHAPDATTKTAVSLKGTPSSTLTSSAARHDRSNTPSLADQSTPSPDAANLHSSSGSIPTPSSATSTPVTTVASASAISDKAAHIRATSARALPQPPTTTTVSSSAKMLDVKTSQTREGPCCSTPKIEKFVGQRTSTQIDVCLHCRRLVKWYDETEKGET